MEKLEQLEKLQRGLQGAKLRLALFADDVAHLTDAEIEELATKGNNWVDRATSLRGAEINYDQLKQTQKIAMHVDDLKKRIKNYEAEIAALQK